MKAISGLPARGVPMLPAVGACRHSRQGSLLQIPSSGGKLGSEGRSSGGCRFIIRHTTATLYARDLVAAHRVPRRHARGGTVSCRDLAFYVVCAENRTLGRRHAGQRPDTPVQESHGLSNLRMVSGVLLGGMRVNYRLCPPGPEKDPSRPFTTCKTTTPAKNRSCCFAADRFDADAPSGIARRSVTIPVREMTKIVEHEIHVIVLCSRFTTSRRKDGPRARMSRPMASDVSASELRPRCRPA